MLGTISIGKAVLIQFTTTAHTMCLVYYVKQPAKANGQSGMIELINSRFDHHIFSQIGGQAFAPSLKMRPAVGSMLVFPSTLLHFVFPNETDEDRISLA